MSEVVITVRGEHERQVAPERAVVSFAISTEGPDRGAVVERIAALAEPVRTDLAARKDAGGLVDWKSARVSVLSQRPWNAEGKHLALVHSASVELTAEFADITALSWWIGDAAEREGVQIGGVQWRLTPATRAAVEREAAAEAVAVAVARATAYAQALGLASVTPLEIADTGFLAQRPSEPRPMARMAFASADSGGGPAFDFHPDDITITATVEARFSAR